MGAPTFSGEQFAMIYHDPYGGIWRTDAIDATSDDNIISSRVQDALRDLPNEVLEGVKVTAQASATPRICHRFDDGQQHLAGFETPHTGHHNDAKYNSNFCKFSDAAALSAHAGNMDFQVEFADKPGQTGVQYLIEVDIKARGAGSFPVSAGITTAASVVSVAEINYNSNLGNLSPTVVLTMVTANANASTATVALPARSSKRSSNQCTLSIYRRMAMFLCPP